MVVVVATALLILHQAKARILGAVARALRSNGGRRDRPRAKSWIVTPQLNPPAFKARDGFSVAFLASIQPIVQRPHGANWRSADGLNGDLSREHDPEKWEPVFGKDHAQAKG
jgi:hypothetical protein